jgi:Zn-dependent peptidase ImmA (M78 family)
MKVLAWASELAAAFWAAAGGPEPFPRTLRGAIAQSSLDLTLMEFPELSLAKARHFLTSQDVSCFDTGPDRRLRGCLAANDGVGAVLLDAGDPPAERILTLAHELAHFLRHYMQPRRLAARRLGTPFMEIIDGQRLPTPAERLRAMLANVPLGLHIHLMERGPRRQFVSLNVAIAEEDADLLAYELLAPATAVFKRIGPAQGSKGRGLLTAVLQEDFGLPLAAAKDYAHVLLPPAYQDSLLLRLPFSPCSRASSFCLRPRPQR